MHLFTNWSFKKHILGSLVLSCLISVVFIIIRRVIGTYLSGLGVSSSVGGFSISFTTSTISMVLFFIIFIILTILYKPIKIFINKF